MIDPLPPRHAFASKPDKQGSKWYVEPAHPHGKTEQVSEFESEAAANRWIAEKSESWLRKPLDEHT
jgi:hypothetical protein